MPLESASTFFPDRRQFLQILLATATSTAISCTSRPTYKYNEGFLADPRFNTGAELERLVMTGDSVDYDRTSVDKLVLSSREAFMNLPVEEWKERLPEGKVTILYPAAGIHIMPLQLGYRIMRQIPKVSEVEFIYTEIDPNVKTGFRQQLAILEGLGLVKNLNITTQNYPVNPGRFRFLDTVPEETTYSFDAVDPSGMPHMIRVVYALNRSGADLFRPEYAKKANIFISHDSDSYSAGKAMVRSALKIDDRYQSEHDVILMSEPEYVFGMLFGMFPTEKSTAFPNKIRLVKGSYGCDGSSQCMLMYLDKDFVNSKVGQRSLSKYFR